MTGKSTLVDKLDSCRVTDASTRLSGPGSQCDNRLEGDADARRPRPESRSAGHVDKGIHVGKSKPTSCQKNKLDGHRAGGAGGQAQLKSSPDGHRVGAVDSGLHGPTNKLGSGSKGCTSVGQHKLVGGPTNSQ